LTDPIVPTTVGTDVRFAPRVLRELIGLRDQTCRWISCGRAARNCELDHTIPWELGGSTTVGNLSFLCARHHHIKHNTDWQMTQDLDGTIHLTDPTGAGYTTYPAMMLNVQPAAGVSTEVADTDDFVATWDDGSETEDSEWVNDGLYIIPAPAPAAAVVETNEDDEEPLPF